MFSNLSLFGTAIRKSRFDIKGFKEEDKAKPDLLVMIAKGDIENAIYLLLAGKNPDQVHRLVTWAAENTDLPPDYVRGRLGVQDYSEVAVGYLWHGYALICLGRYGEALPLLTGGDPALRPGAEERRRGLAEGRVCPPEGARTPLRVRARSHRRPPESGAGGDRDLPQKPEDVPRSSQRPPLLFPPQEAVRRRLRSRSGIVRPTIRKR